MTKPSFPKLIHRHAAGRLMAACSLALLVSACASKPPQATLQTAQILQLGDAAAQQGDLGEALLHYSQAAGADPRNADAHLRVASAQMAMGNLPVAAKACQRALAAQPGSASALQCLGLSQLKQGRRVEAKERLQAATQADPYLWRSYDGLGILADLEGEHALAQQHFRRALSLMPGLAGLHSNLAYSLYLAGQLNLAHAEVMLALKQDPANERAWSNLGLILIRRGDAAGGALALERVLQGPQAHYDAGYLCMLNRRYQDAEQQFKLAIAQSPSYYAEAHEALSQLGQLQSGRTSP